MNPFPTQAGVRQGSVLTSLLLDIFIAAMIIIIDKILKEDVGVRFRTDGSIFNRKRLTGLTKSRQHTYIARTCSIDKLQSILNTFEWTNS